jgi:hypothetical protein
MAIEQIQSTNAGQVSLHANGVSLTIVSRKYSHNAADLRLSNRGGPTTDTYSDETVMRRSSASLF